MGSGGSFGGNPYLQHVGVGNAERIERLEVFWPATGETQVFEDVAVDQYLRITEGADAFEVVPRQVRPFQR